MYTKLYEVYMNIPRFNKQNINVKNAICNECHITTQTFRNWLYGISKVPALCRPIVAKHLNVKENELFTN
jgi:hypothetical protein